MKLDFMLFGSGWGLGAPASNQAFYWLGDRFYTWIGGLGAQLQSIEWRAPPAGTHRRILGKDFIVFTVSRRWLKVRVAWALSPSVKDMEEVRALKRLLP